MDSEENIMNEVERFEKSFTYRIFKVLGSIWKGFGREYKKVVDKHREF